MLKGSLVPNITIFDKQGKIDFEKTSWHMNWMFEKGVDGLFLTGSYGAGPLMTNEERLDVIRTAKEIAARHGNKIILPHVGCIDTAHTIELAQAVDKLGVDAIGAVPPFYYKHTDEIIIAYYKDIIDAVKTPVFAYNNPETSRYTFNLKTIRALKEYGLAGMKDSPLSIGFLSRVAYEAQDLHNDFQVIAGTSTGWLPLYYMGIRATIAGMNNWAPEIMTEMVRATFADETEKARKAYLVMMDLSAKLHFTDSTIASHMALYARGFDAGYPRKPMFLPPFSDARYKEIRLWLEEGFAELGLPFTAGNCSIT
ncbi:MAG: dihydrodipicolinate synthase family protein [Treponema sp.]|jgi:dihydrodipicolinate synthase/N-acetylneuraminate lyase|nr:dihydrodipicolinate synthase family protein [Treponema sp.]